MAPDRSGATEFKTCPLFVSRRPFRGSVLPREDNENRKLLGDVFGAE